MAVSAAVFLTTSNLFCLFLLSTAVTAHGNTTSYNLNTVYGDQNVTYNVTDNYTTTQPTEFDSTTPTTSNYISTDEPVQPTTPAEPLPVTRRLLPPVTEVGSVCPCDIDTDVCDINCCCDRACSEEVALFTGCLVDYVSGKKQLCSIDVATYLLGRTVDGFSELKSSVRNKTNYDAFCIQSQNRVDGLSHPSPALPTESNFDSLFKEFTSFIFGSEENGGLVTPAQLQSLSGYQFGDVMVTAGESGQRGMFWLPGPCITADCMDTSPAVFLKDQSSWCSRRVVLQQDCVSLPALRMDTYTDIRLFAGKTQDAAELVPVEVASVVLQSVDGTQTALKVNGEEHLNPVLLNSTFCANVVLKVAYVTKYNPAGEIVNVTVSLVLGFVRKAALRLEQEFHITFVQENGEEVAVHYSGNPGYVVGLPLVSGTRTAEGIARSVNPRDTVSLLHSAEDQDCLQGPHQRSPVLFGLDSVSGCTLRLEDAVNCSLVLQVLLDVLRGPNAMFVASFGNSPLDYPSDWVPIESTFNPGEAQKCRIPMSLHIEIEWTKYGSLVNPQAQIVSIKEVIQTNTTSLDKLSGGSSLLSIRSSVAFVPVSAAALPGYRATPTINAKLPFDFFFPFV
ncbi:tectonic-1 isoform X2 [Pseudoliparis swirei]|uniref:tectonic-1 isoform X2 n=1 Tax=Pseudoliparis swirei TaxID=2059687 RepID=UPI0024BE4702|nr:tectonic-1 isoform X2 [Pseudoliparis swirei]